MKAKTTMFYNRTRNETSFGVIIQSEPGGKYNTMYTKDGKEIFSVDNKVIANLEVKELNKIFGL